MVIYCRCFRAALLTDAKTKGTSSFSKNKKKKKKKKKEKKKKKKNERNIKKPP